MKSGSSVILKSDIFLSLPKYNILSTLKKITQYLVFFLNKNTIDCYLYWEKLHENGEEEGQKNFEIFCKFEHKIKMRGNFQKHLAFFHKYY